MSVPSHRTMFNQVPPQHAPAAQELPTTKQPLGLHSPNLLFLPVHSKTCLGNCPFVLRLAKPFLVLKYNFNKLNTQLHLLVNYRKLYCFQSINRVIRQLSVTYNNAQDFNFSILYNESHQRVKREASCSQGSPSPTEYYKQRALNIQCKTRLLLQTLKAESCGSFHLLIL